VCDVQQLLGGEGVETPRAYRDIERVMNDCRYAGYLVRQQAEIKRQREADGVSIPADLDAASIEGLRSEAKDVLARFRPATLGQASRLAGINPADITVLRVVLGRTSRR
jgi:tRNA uridine 5-carboxymethylaminomethyl modification enzyme